MWICKIKNGWCLLLSSLILSVNLWVCLKPIKHLIIQDKSRQEKFNKQAAEHTLQINVHGVEQIVISTAIYCKPWENVQKRISIENTTSEQLENSAKVIKILRSFKLIITVLQDFWTKHCANLENNDTITIWRSFCADAFTLMKNLEFYNWKDNMFASENKHISQNWLLSVPLCLVPSVYCTK